MKIIKLILLLLISSFTLFVSPGYIVDDVNTLTKSLDSSEKVSEVVIEEEIRDSLITKVNLECFRQELIDSAITKRKLSGFIKACGREIVDVMTKNGVKISDNQLLLIASTIVSHNFAPYGGSAALNYNEIVKEKALDCSNYAALLGHLVNPKITDEIRFIGFEGGVVGNHTQVFYDEENKEMVLDPTTSSIAFVDYDSLFEVSHSPRKVFVFNRQNNVQLEKLYKNVDNALSLSLFKPSDILYYYFNLNHFIGKFSYSYKTPGGYKLHKRGR
jgi:hypothetical protein